jgi:hypothetical protein
MRSESDPALGDGPDCDSAVRERLRFVCAEGIMRTSDVFFVIAAVLWALPAAAGVVDALCWFSMGEQCTPIPWSADGDTRVFFAIGWTVVLPVLLLALAA